MRELLAARARRVREVWVAQGTETDRAVAEIVDLAGAAGTPLRLVLRGRIDAAAGTEAPQGVLAFADPVPEADLGALARGPSGGPAPFLLVLDGVTDPHNLGALLRTATGAGATGVVVGRHRAAHLSPAAVKAAAGAVEHLPIAVVPGIPAALGVLAEAGVWTVGLDAGAGDELWTLPVGDEPVAVVLGAEGRGLSRLGRERCDVLAHVPLAGPLSSLNVAAAGALACFEVARRRAPHRP